MRLFDRLRNGVNRVAESMDLFKKDVFELEGVPAFREYYTLFIFMWQAVYKGFYKAWHEVPIKTLNNPKGKTRIMNTMNAGKMACSQMARYVWNERCTITASMEGNDGEEDLLNDYLHIQNSYLMKKAILGFRISRKCFTFFLVSKGR